SPVWEDTSIERTPSPAPKPYGSDCNACTTSPSAGKPSAQKPKSQHKDVCNNEAGWPGLVCCRACSPQSLDRIVTPTPECGACRGPLTISSIRDLPVVCHWRLASAAFDRHFARSLTSD